MHVQKGNRFDNINGTWELDFKQLQAEASRTLGKTTGKAPQPCWTWIGSRFLRNGVQIKNDLKGKTRSFHHHRRMALVPRASEGRRRDAPKGYQHGD